MRIDITETNYTSELFATYEGINHRVVACDIEYHKNSKLITITVEEVGLGQNQQAAVPDSGRLSPCPRCGVQRLEESWTPGGCSEFGNR